MRGSSAAVRHVVERCPSCGVEHDLSAESMCEACRAPLAFWCRVHGRETGWLEGPACARCADEAARTQSARSHPAAYATPPAGNDAAMLVPSPSPGPKLRPQSAVREAERRRRAGFPWRLHYLVKLTLFLTCFGAVFGAAFGTAGGEWGGDLWIFVEGGIIGGVCASILGALSYLVNSLFRKRK